MDFFLSLFFFCQGCCMKIAVGIQRQAEYAGLAQAFQLREKISGGLPGQPEHDISEVKVTRNNDYYLFDNVANEDKAIIFYGGAKVQEKSYAPMLNKIAHLGTDVYLVNMPFSFPLFARNKADSVYRTNNTYSKVYLMGHSLGGVCAAMNLEKTTLDYEGIIFLAAYPSHKIDDKYKALSIYGSEDHVMNLKEYTANSSYFPSGYVTKVIEGANHANYGYYGKQKGDGVALLTREQQIDITINYVKDFIN